MFNIQQYGLIVEQPTSPITTLVFTMFNVAANISRRISMIGY